MNLKKFLSLGFLLVSALALTACGGEEEIIQDEVIETSVTQPTEIVEKTEPTEIVEQEVVVPEEPPRDLGGLVVTIASWADVKEPEEKKSAYEEALWEYRNEMMEKHNFGFEELALSAWNGTLELMSTSTMAGDPAAEIFRFNANFNGAVKESGLCYDWASLESIDITDDRWSQTANELMSDGDKVYGISLTDRPQRVIFFNKRLFEEAGLDGELLYDLQASGDWTWDVFMEISEQLTRDTDNDGINDTYALVSQNGKFAQAAVFSNGGSYVNRDENGKYYNNITSPESVEALEWAAEFWKTGYEAVPSHWNGHLDLFKTGGAAMHLAEESTCVTLTKDAMDDDWGMVLFPKGPQADDYVAIYNEKTWVIPSSYTKEEAEDIAFAINLWTAPIEGYDGPDDWMATYYPLYRDARAVEESLVTARKEDVMGLDYGLFLSSAGVNTGLIASDVYYGKATVAESIEAQAGIWQAALDKLNE